MSDTGARSNAGRFDVFLSHHGRDAGFVERVAEKLTRLGLKPWFDKWCVTAGVHWHEQLAAGLGASSACAVFIGPSDVGAWEREELAVALDIAAKERSFRVFLVLLPGLPDPFDATTLSPFLSTRTWVDFRGGLQDVRALQAIVNATKGIPSGPQVAIAPRDDVLPYRGLEVFDEQHAKFFFGRDADIQRLVEKLKASSFVAVVGASGSGKSSLARAGLVPALRAGALAGSECWRIVTFRPSPHPLDALAAQLTSLYPDLAAAGVRDQLAADARTLRLLCSRAPERSTRVLFLIDQLEEVFTLCREEDERRAFLLNVLHVATADGPSIVVPTLRADFYARCTTYPELAQQLGTHQFLVGALDEEGLRQAIAAPAHLVGLDLEAGLVDTIINDVAHQPGTLPLLEHALLELWQRRRGSLLTLEAYRDTGGVEGALAQRADAILASFDSHERAVMRRVLLRLTQPGEGAEDTRRRAPMSELMTERSDSGSVEIVVGALTQARLLTASGGGEGGERVVDVSHEALIRGWPQLRRWVEEDRQGLRIHRRLTEAAREWRALGRDSGALYRGARLAASREWANDHGEDLNELEREFLASSSAAQAGELEAARVRARRLRSVAGGFAVLAVLAGVLALIAVRSADRAGTQERIATSRRLAIESGQVLASRPETALLLSLEAYGRAPTHEARSGLVTAFQRAAWSSKVLYTEHSDATAVAFSPRTDALVFVDRQGNIRRWNRAGRPLGTPVHGSKEPVNLVAVSPDGSAVAFALGTDVVVWTSADRHPTATRLGHRGLDVNDLSFSADGHKLAVSDDDNTVELWRIDRHPALTWRRRVPGHYSSISLSPDARVLAVASGLARTLVRLLDAARGTLRHTLRSSSLGGRDVVFSRDGKLLALFSRNSAGPQAVELWDAARQHAAGRIRTKFTTLGDVAFSPDGTRLAVSNRVGAIERWDTRTRRRVGARFTGGRAAVTSLAFRSDGSLLAAGSSDGTVRLWRTGAREAVATPLGHHRRAVTSIAFAPGGRLISADRQGALRTWNPARRSSDVEIGAGSDRPRGNATLSDEGRLAAIHGIGHAIRIFDVRHRRIVANLRTRRAVVTPILDPIRVAFSRERIATLDESYDFQLWDATGSREGHPLSKRISGEAIAFAPHGQTVAFMQYGVVSLFDARRHTRIPRQFRLASDEDIREPGLYAALAFSRDGRTLASSGPNGTIRLWDVASRRLLVDPMAGHQGGVTSLAFTPDGTVLASAGEDGTIRLFDVRQRRALGTPLLAHAPVRSLTFDKTGRRLASAGEDGRILLWDPLLWSTDAAAWRARVCHIVRRNLTSSEHEEFLPGERPSTTCPAGARG